MASVAVDRASLVRMTDVIGINGGRGVLVESLVLDIGVGLLGVDVIGLCRFQLVCDSTGAIRGCDIVDSRSAGLHVSAGVRLNI